MVFTYCLQQAIMLAVVHAIFLFWGINFPFSYRQLQVSGRIRYAHITSAVIVLILPLLSALVPLRDGYVSLYNPKLACVGRNTNITYYTFILPNTIFVGITSCLLLLTFWTVFKVSTQSLS